MDTWKYFLHSFDYFAFLRNVPGIFELNWGRDCILRHQSDLAPLDCHKHVKKCGQYLIQWLSLKVRYSQSLFSTCFVQVTTFLDYIRGGVKLHLVAAIDFTTSNGKPSDPHSLHHYNPQGTSSHENPYTMAIRTIGDIFQGIIVHQEISAVVSLPLYWMLRPSKQELD